MNNINTKNVNNSSPTNHHSLALSSLLLPLFVTNGLVVNTAMATPPSHAVAWAKGQILVQPQTGLSEQNFKKILAKFKANSKGKINNLRTHIISVPAQAEQAIIKQPTH